MLHQRMGIVKPWKHLLLVTALQLCKSTSAVIDFTTSPLSQGVLLGHDLRIDCVAQEIPSTEQTLSYSWYHNSTVVDAGSPETTSSIFSNKSLFIPAVRYADLGRYQCNVRISGNPSDMGQNTTATVVKAYIDDFAIPPQSHDITDIETALFQSVTGYSAPPPDIWWEKDGVLFSGGVQTKFIFGSFADGGAVKKTLLLELNGSALVEGNYTSVARNPLTGEIKYSVPAPLTVRLVLRYPVIETQPPPSITAPRGQPTVLNCRTSGQPRPTISWLKDGVNLTFGSQRLLLSNGSLQFLNLQDTDRGVYECVASNSIGQIQSNPSDLQVASLGYEFVTNPADVTVVAGNTAAMHCSSPTSIPPANISWYKNNRLLIQRSGEYAVTVLNSGDLYFSNVQIDDEGTYFCVAENLLSIPTSRTSTVASLSVEAAPIFTEPPSPTRVVKDHLLTLNCYVAGDPKPTIRWFKDEQELLTTNDPRVSFHDSGQQLILANMHKGDEGTYKCTATNSFRTSTSPEVFVFVIVPPEILNSIGQVVAVSGHRIIVPCGVYGAPTPTVIWFKDNVVIQENSRIRYTSEGLEIMTVVTADEGSYKCFTQNEGGNKTSDGSLIVHVAPYFISRPAGQTVKEGNHIQIGCEVGGIPTPTITWKYNASTNYPAGMIMTTNRSIINIAYGMSHHTGMYTCIASNVQGTIQYSAGILVIVVPKVTGIQGQNIIGESSDLYLSCITVGTPTPTVTWQKDNQSITADTDLRITYPLANDIRVRFVRKADAGEYKCIATNNAGSGFGVLNVYVRDPPRPPILYEVTPMSTSSVNVSWIPVVQDENNNISSFVVQYKERVHPEYQLFRDNIPPDLTSIEVGSLRAATSYHFRVGAKNEIGIGDFSGPKLVTTFETAPSEPRNFKNLVITSTMIQLQWETPAVKNGDIRKYQVQYKKKNSNNEFTVMDINNPIVPIHQVIIDSLHPYTEYEFKVRGATVEQNVWLWGNFTSLLSIVTKMDKPSAAPGNLLVTVKSSRMIRVSWQSILPENENGPIKGYLLFYKLLNSSDDDILINVTASQTQLNISNLLPWQQYSVEISGYNVIGDSPRSPVQIVRTNPEAPSGVPENVRAESLSPTSIRIFWEEVDSEDRNGEIAGYIVHYGKEGENGFMTVTVNGADILSVNISELQANTEYTVRVQAFTNQLNPGEGPLSDPLTIKSKEDRPGPVENIVILVYPYSVHLKWGAPVDPRGTIIMYYISYHTIISIPLTTNPNTTRNITTADSSPFINNTLLTPNTYIVIGGLYPSTEYQFTILAETNGGKGLHTKTISVETSGSTVGPPTKPPEQTTEPVLTTPFEEFKPPQPEPWGLRPQDLPILIGAVAGGALLIIILVIVCICCCCNRRKRKEDKKTKRYFVPPSTSTRMAGGERTASEVSESDRKAAVLDIVEIQSTDNDYDPNPYSMGHENSFKKHQQASSNPESSPRSVGSGTPNSVNDMTSAVNRSASDPSYAKVKRHHRRRDPIYDNAYSSMDELNLAHIPENQLKHVEHPYPSSSIGFDNPNFEAENDLDKSSRSVKVSNIPMAPMNPKSREGDIYSRVNYGDKKKHRMKRESAAAIAAQRNRKSAPTPDDMDSLINNESVVVYDERTAL